MANRRASVSVMRFGRGNLFYLVGAAVERCDLRFTAHLVTPHSMLPFSTLNGRGHSEIVKLGVENSAGLPAVPSGLPFQNLLLLAVFSFERLKSEAGSQLFKVRCDIILFPLH